MIDTRDSTQLAEVRRARLRDLMDRLEAALAEPSHRAGWATALNELAGELEAELTRHVEETEADDGLFADVMQRAPRLRNAVDRLRTDHPELRTTLAQFADSLREPPLDTDRIAAIRELGSTLLVDLMAHRQRGADLLYEAYWIDVAPSD
jgi:hypothetical protein